MTHQTTGQGPLRPPPGNPQRSHNSTTRPTTPRQPSTTSTHNPQPPSPEPAPPAQHLKPRHPTNHTQHQPTHRRPQHQQPAPRRPAQGTNNQTPGLPARPSDGLASQPPDPDDYSPSTAPNSNSHPMHLRCKQDLTKPFIFRVLCVNILFTFEPKPLNLKRCFCKRSLMPKKRKADKTTPVGFRLSDDKIVRLRSLAVVAGAKSAGDYARDLVMAKMDEQETINREIQQLRAEFQTFRSDFALAVEALLVASSNKQPLSAEQARQWVEDRIRRPSNLPRKA